MGELGKIKRAFATTGAILVGISLISMFLTPTVCAYGSTYAAPYNSCLAWTSYGVTSESGAVSATPAIPSMSASSGSGTMGALIDTEPVSHAQIVERIALSGCEFTADSTSQKVTTTWQATAGGTYWTDGLSGGTVSVYIVIFVSLFDVTSSTPLEEKGKIVMSMVDTDNDFHTFSGGPWTSTFYYTWTGLTPNHEYLVQNALYLQADCSSIASSGHLNINVGGTCQSIVLG